MVRDVRSVLFKKQMAYAAGIYLADCKGRQGKNNKDQKGIQNGAEDVIHI